MKTESTLPDSAGTVCYLVSYPSGNTFYVTGRFVRWRRFSLTAVDECLLPVIEQPGGGVLILDQRGVVTHGGVTVYSPRRNLDSLQSEMTKWLNEHPDWAK